MKKLTNIILIATALLFLSEIAIQAQTPIDQWGLSSEGKAWPILNDASTSAGDAGMGDGNIPTGWATIRGGFSDMSLKTDEFLIVSGQLEFVGGGGGSAYTHFRYAMTFRDSSTLNNALTDSADWTSPKAHYGYGFQPRTGAGTMANGRGGAATLWLVDGGGFNSGWGGNNTALVAINQAPRNAEMVAGTYDFAIAVRKVSDTESEVKWYLVEENNQYWFGGTVIDTATTDKYNGICFGLNNDSETTQFNVIGAQVSYGDIEIPEAPWQAYYVDQWGLSAEYNTIWPILNDSSTFVGDGSMGGEYVSGWKGLQGGFGQDLPIKTDEALIVEGQMEFVGADAGAAYTALRYALTYQDSNSTLVNALTDSATWSHQGNHFGYEFTPRTGAGTMANGGGGAGTVWTINNGNWASTWSNGGGPVTDVVQAPRNAEITAGTYDFAISVQAIDDTTNEVRWYMIEENNQYWFGGTIRTLATTKKINSIIFGINEVEWTQFNAIAVKVDYGAPIEVPEAPWQAYYVDQWGLSSEGQAWPILNDSTTLVGDASMGDGNPPTGWATIRGGFGQDLPLKTDEFLFVSGQLEFVGGGGGSAYTHFRYAMTFRDSSTLNNALTDSADWTSPKAHYGYGFQPRTGAGTMANGRGGAATLWLVDGGGFNSGWGGNNTALVAINQAPRNAEMVAGTYDFAIAVRKVSDTESEVKWYLIEENNEYWFGGTEIVPSTTNKYNGICFGLNNDSETTQFNVIAAKVDYGNIVVPEAPWESYYIDLWGLSGEYNSIWPILNDSTTLVGDASMGGDVVSGWKGLQGGFGQDVTITTEDAIIVEGQIEFVGADAGAAYTPIRYALTYQDSNSTLVNALTDSATWSHTGNHFGYGFHPRTGAGTVSNGAGGSGTVWTINNGNWASTYSNNGGPIASVVQAPRNAEIIAGTYDFAISVQAINDSTNEIRWYMIEENNQYWFGGTVREAATTQKFNSIIFGVNEVEFTAFNVIAMQVDKGDPIVVPDAPFEDFYVGDWGFIGGRTGTWALAPGDIVGNVTISGSGAAGGWSAVRGDFGLPSSPTLEKALAITGKIELTGGGFEDWSSLRFGIFNSESAGTLDSTEAGYAWNGTEDSQGYLFLPHSGTNDVPTWNGTPGTVGAINNTSWISTNGAGSYVLGDVLQAPEGAVGSAGEYDFAVYVIEKEDGSQDIRYILQKSDQTYTFANTVTDATPVTESFNSFNFGLNSTTATGVNLVDIHVDQIDISQVPVGVDESSASSGLPTEFALSQNYPNPFNPSTTIEFALPKSSNVRLVVYDILGRTVVNLVNGNLNAGYHKINFNASNFASGIYFYRIEAGDFVSVKKLMLLK